MLPRGEGGDGVPAGTTTDCVIEDPRWAAEGLEILAERAARAALAGSGLDPAAFGIALLACDDARMATLNAEFRGEAAPTNVLSWPSRERAAAAPGARPDPPDPHLDADLGDIAIAYETCAREAEATGLPLSGHATRLIVHGVLHLLGFCHTDENDAKLMEDLEAGILDRLGAARPNGCRA